MSEVPILCANQQRIYNMDHNRTKREVLAELKYLASCMHQKRKILNAVDCDTDSSGAYDLHDQLNTLFHAVESIRTCVNRSLEIVPYTSERD